MTTYRTKWGSDMIEISADFAQASDQVAGTNGRQVADFRHNPSVAMRYTIEREAETEGLDINDVGVEEWINDAVDTMTEIN